MPWLSHHSTFTRSPERPRNTKTCPDKGSSCRTVFAVAASPSNPLRMSVLPAASQTLVCGGNPSISDPTPVRGGSAASARWPQGRRAAAHWPTPPRCVPQRLPLPQEKLTASSRPVGKPIPARTAVGNFFRHANSWAGSRLCRRATSQTVTSGSQLSSTIRRFSRVGQVRRFRPSMINAPSKRTSHDTSVELLLSIHEVRPQRKAAITGRLQIARPHLDQKGCQRPLALFTQTICDNLNCTRSVYGLIFNG